MACCLHQSCFRGGSVCSVSVCADGNQLSDWLTVEADSTDMRVICDVHFEDRRLGQTAGRAEDDKVV